MLASVVQWGGGGRGGRCKNLFAAVALPDSHKDNVLRDSQYEAVNAPIQYLHRLRVSFDTAAGG